MATAETAARGAPTPWGVRRSLALVRAFRVEQTDPDRYVAMDKAATSIGTRTGVFYAARDRVYLAAPPHANIGAALLVFEAQD